MLGLLFSYVAVVEQRPPVLRAALMTAIVVIGGSFYRRLDLLNSAAIAALLLLIARPLAVRDTSFQLSFVAIGCIAALAMPWLERTVQPYVRALRGWRDITRDAAHEPQHTQFRMDLRSFCAWISAHVPQRAARPVEAGLVAGMALAFRVWELFVLSLVLQIGMLPLMARDFHRIPLAGPFVNLVAVPLTGVIVPLGFVTVSTALIFPALGRMLAVPLAWLTLAQIHLVQWFAHVPSWSYRIPGPPWWLILVFFGAAILLAVGLRLTLAKARWSISTACGLLIASALIVAAYPFSPKRDAGQLEVTILDVGQGDSLFVVSPKGRTMLIDGGGAFEGFQGREEHLGPDPGEDAVSPYLWSRGFRKLDIVALTHAHQDHIGGLISILENFPVGHLWIGREVAAPALARLEKLARMKSIPIEHQIRGNSLSWDGVAGVFLWPEIPPEQVGTSAKNNDSLVLRLHYGERSVMLPGDAEQLAEYNILAENNEGALQADVLKVGHHGGKNSTTPEFLAAVRPHVAIISVGVDNPYGHPNPELLERLEQARVRILRTDRDGAVHVLTDGHRVEVSCYVACLENSGITPSGHTQFPNDQQHNQ
jgi:competence protein ComEC